MLGVPSPILRTGVAEAVGVRYYTATDAHPPLRIFYPTNEPSKKFNKSYFNDEPTSQGPLQRLLPFGRQRPIRWFEETGGSLQFLKGYTHMAFIRHTTAKFRWLAVPILAILSFFLPLSWLRVPGVYKNVPFHPTLERNNGKHSTTKTTTTVTEDSSKTEGHRKLLPVIVFSHGLTGTGQENVALCAAWAKQGYIVIGIQHTDGSACHVKLADGSDLYYVHPPPYSRYDPTFRPKQVTARAREFIQARNFILPDPYGSINDSKELYQRESRNDKEREDRQFLEHLRQWADPNRVVAAGFSFGAATVARAIAMDEPPKEQTERSDEATVTKRLFSGALFLDGWFHIDVMRSANVEFNFPQEAFYGHKENTTLSTTPPTDKNSPFDPIIESRKWNIPALFINSVQFQSYSKLFAATKALASKMKNPSATTAATVTTTTSTSTPLTTTIPTNGATIEVLNGSGHQNFCDVIFWLNTYLLQKLLMGTVGKDIDPAILYQHMLELSTTFFSQVFEEL